MIRVIYNNGEEDLVTPKFLDILLHLNEIEQFQRADGWTSATSTHLRTNPLGSYSGKERRRHTRAVLQPFALQNKQPSQAGKNS